MKPGPPTWAMEPLQQHERERAVRARQSGVLKPDWEPIPGIGTRNYGGEPVTKGPPKQWARERGWPRRWLSFAEGFLDTMLESDQNFALALVDAGVRLYAPKAEHVVPRKDLEDFDRLYKSWDQRKWGVLVEGLRELRRAVEAGVDLVIQDRRITTWNEFYNWAHGRYHALEDGYDEWIGTD